MFSAIVKSTRRHSVDHDRSLLVEQHRRLAWFSSSCRAEHLLDKRHVTDPDHDFARHMVFARYLATVGTLNEFPDGEPS